MQLLNAKFQYTRIDGSMSVKKRDVALEKLDKDPKCTVLLASLGVCSVGLNLVAVCSYLITMLRQSNVWAGQYSNSNGQLVVRFLC